VHTRREARRLGAVLPARAFLALCDEWIERRLPLIHEAERQLAWFAEVPARALKSGVRPALASR